jgi:hypothetical protein
MRAKPHSHPCCICQKLTECCGDIEQNHDGWPEWVCVEYHKYGDDVTCEDCLSTTGDSETETPDIRG